MSIDRMGEPILVMDQGWDYLIILDACRFDYFKDVYRDYLCGTLEKRISLGSSTPQWCRENFVNKYRDVVYISGNPHINSVKKVANFNAREHFGYIVDVWDKGWDRTLGTVPPRELNKAVRRFINVFPEKKMIIHYLQPHDPYISKEYFLGGFRDPFTTGPLMGTNTHKQCRLIEKGLSMLDYILGRIDFCNTWKVREELGLPPAVPMDAVRRAFGNDSLSDAYEENLRIALRNVSNLASLIISKCPAKKIVLSSDHGELLGEGGRYMHFDDSTLPQLLEIPWFIVDGVKDSIPNSPRIFRTKSGVKNRLLHIG